MRPPWSQRSTMPAHRELDISLEISCANAYAKSTIRADYRVTFHVRLRETSRCVISFNWRSQTLQFSHFGFQIGSLIANKLQYLFPSWNNQICLPTHSKNPLAHSQTLNRSKTWSVLTHLSSLTNSGDSLASAVCQLTRLPKLFWIIGNCNSSLSNECQLS